MAKLGLFLKKIKANIYYSHFAVETLLFLILVFTVGTNIALRSNSQKAVTANRSLFFVYLKNHSSMNNKLVDTYESLNLKLTQAQVAIQKQVLAASTKNKENSGELVTTMPLPTLSGSALLKPNPASSSGFLIKRDIEVYVVRGGDTVARIAAAFGVSEYTIMEENRLSASGLIRPGQELRILPVSGIKHTVKTGETISSIAKKYGLGEEGIEQIFEYNGIEVEEGHIFPGDELIIPNGVKPAPPTPQRQQYLAELQKEDYKKVEVPGDYQGGSSGLIWPVPAATRVSQKYWSRHRAIDVPCRDCQVVAAGNGIVELSGWLKGYGYNVLINHGNGLKTRYAHGKELLVTAGESVVQGQAIMISGSTGRSSGPHLHFEIKQNGALVNPLLFVSR